MASAIQTPPARPRRLIAAVPGGALALAATLLLLLLVVSPPPDTSLVVFTIGVALLPLMLGLGLLHYGLPMLWPGAKSCVARLGQPEFWRATRRQAVLAFAPPRLAASPFRRLALALLIAALGYVIAPRGARSIGIFLAFLVSSIADPAINAFRPRWWMNTAKSLIGFIAQFAVAAIIGEVDKIGEAGMIFVLPVVIYPFAVGISGLIRFLWFYLRPA